MTEKQEKILEAASELFAREGFHATSTSKVAKRAGVSEGLIFRHYKNKEGLLSAVMTVGEERFKAMYADIVMETDPKEVIKKSLELPFNVKEEEYEFWTLQFKLKWELQEFGAEKMEPMQRALVAAFEKLGVDAPEMEAAMVLFLLDGVSTSLLKGTVDNKEELRKFLLKKYNL